jgi:hypothetical protein
MKSKPALPTPSPIMAMAEHLASIMDRVNAYDELHGRLYRGEIAYGTTKPEQADEWMRTAEAADAACREAIMQTEPATLTDAAILAVLAACELDSLNASKPIEGEHYRHTIGMLYTAVGALAWVLARHCRDKLPASFVERFARSIEVCHRHGPPLGDLPIQRNGGAA